MTKRLSVKLCIVDEGQYMDIDQLKKWNNQEIKDICNQKLGNKAIRWNSLYRSRAISYRSRK